MSAWADTVDRYLAEGRTVSGGKEDSSGKAARDQEARNNKLQDLANQNSSKFMNDLYANTRKYLSGNIGMTPEQLADANSQFINQNSQYFNNAGQNVRAALAGRGVGSGDQPIGGNYVRGIAGLEGLRGATGAAGLQDIRLQNYQLALQNKWNAANLFSNAGANYGQQALGYGGLANQNISQIHQAFRPGIMENFGNAFGESLGKGLGGGLAGGLTGGLGGVIYGAGAAAAPKG